MNITKLNDDSSWLIDFTETTLIIDPWFTPYQVDFARWFSIQYHVTKQPAVTELKNPDYIFISNPFTDHCNKETLVQFDPSIPIIGNKKVLNKIKKWGHFKELMLIENAPIQIELIKGNNPIDLVHNAYFIQCGNESILYAPHGSKVKEVPKVNVLITTTSRYQLPFWLGGKVNLGYSAAIKLLRKTNCKIVLASHDEQKIGKGLVEFLAKKKYVNPKNANTKIKFLGQGETITI